MGLVKRSFSVSGHRTSVALEREFWSALGAIAAERGQSLSALVADRDARRDSRQPLASALRVFALCASSRRKPDGDAAERDQRVIPSHPRDETAQERKA